MTASEATLSAGLLAPLAAVGLDLEDVSVSRAGRRHVVRVVVDADGGVDLDRIAEASRVVSDVLDDPALGDAVPGPYVLEVTSPGVDRPLTEPRHWRRACGRLVVVDLADGSQLTGRIVALAAAEDAVTMDANGTVTRVDLSTVRRAVVQVEFGRVDDDAPTAEEG